MKNHTISVLVENKSGVLNHISGLFAGRGFNIDSLSVGKTDDPSVSRMTIVVEGDDATIEQVTKQLNRLIDVIKVIDLTSQSFVERELVLFKVKADRSSRSEIMAIADVFRAKIIDISPGTLTVEATGSTDKVNAIISMLKPFGVKEIARTGKVALSREFRGRT